MVPMARRVVVGGQAAHREQAGLLHFDEERGGLALLGADRHGQHDLVAASGATTFAVVLMSSEICGLQLPSIRGPFGASYEQSLRYTDWIASIGPCLVFSSPRVRSGFP